jgi:hypothetical protein
MSSSTITTILLADAEDEASNATKFSFKGIVSIKSKLIKFFPQFLCRWEERLVPETHRLSYDGCVNFPYPTYYKIVKTGGIA